MPPPDLTESMASAHLRGGGHYDGGVLYRLIRPILFLRDAERAHDMALRAMARLSRARGCARAVHGVLARPGRADVRAMGLTFPHRVGLAAGLDKNGVAPLAWWAVGFGFVELGTVTPKPQAGNDRPRMFRLVRERALVNRMGFNNDGAAAVAGRLAAQRDAGLWPAFPVGISVGKNATTPLESAEDDYAQAAAILSPHADFITMNVSSPNTAGLRDLQSAAALRRLIAAVQGAAAGKPLLVKFAPEVDGDELRAVLDVVLEAGIAGVIATNTLSTAGRDDLPKGGLSGRPLREISVKRVAAIREHVGDRLTVIGCGGIEDVAGARTMLGAGADLIQLYSALVYQGPLLAARISRGLRGNPHRHSLEGGNPGA
jgi:dihydroorotate dehydrogenase